MKTIELEWMNMIRKQMGKHKIHPNPAIESFIRPIIEYGEQEEQRITDDFKKILGEHP